MTEIKHTYSADELAKVALSDSDQFQKEYMADFKNLTPSEFKKVISDMAGKAGNNVHFEEHGKEWELTITHEFGRFHKPNCEKPPVAHDFRISTGQPPEPEVPRTAEPELESDRLACLEMPLALFDRARNCNEGDTKITLDIYNSKEADPQHRRSCAPTLREPFKSLERDRGLSSRSVEAAV